MWGAVRNDSCNSREAFGSVETSILCTVHLRDGRCRLRRKSEGCSEHSERRTSPAQERECSPASGQPWTHTRGQASPRDKSRGVVDLGASRRAWPLEKKRTVDLAISRLFAVFKRAEDGDAKLYRYRATSIRNSRTRARKMSARGTRTRVYGPRREKEKKATGRGDVYQKLHQPINIWLRASRLVAWAIRRSTCASTESCTFGLKSRPVSFCCTRSMTCTARVLI